MIERDLNIPPDELQLGVLAHLDRLAAQALADGDREKAWGLLTRARFIEGIRKLQQRQAVIATLDAAS